MIASISHRFVFQHIPKNAGTAIHDSIRAAFASDPTLVVSWGIEDGVDLAHPLPPCVKKRLPAVYGMLYDEGTHGIAILRDPLTRCVAAFREHRVQYRDHPAAVQTLSGYLDRIEAGCYREEGGDGYLFIHGAPQHEFLHDEERLLYRNLLRLDDPLFYHKLCLLVGADLKPLTQTNASTGRSVHVPAAEVRRILKIYEKDYELMDSIR